MQRLGKDGMETGVGGKAHGGAADADDNGEEEAGSHGEDGGGWGGHPHVRHLFMQ